MRNKILIVEDERTLLQVLADKFQQENFEVLKAGDGEEGLEVALKEKPDLVLLDIIMPKMDGISMLRKLRIDDWGKSVPVIMLSNLSDEEKMTEALSSNSLDYLVKTDWSIEEVVRKVKKKLGQQ